MGATNASILLKLLATWFWLALKFQSHGPRASMLQINKKSQNLLFFTWYRSVNQKHRSQSINMTPRPNILRRCQLPFFSWQFLKYLLFVHIYCVSIYFVNECVIRFIKVTVDFFKNKESIVLNPQKPCIHNFRQQITLYDFKILSDQV